MIKSIFHSVKLIPKELLFAGFLFIGIAKCYAETEPNNTRETANAFALNSNMSGSFSQADNSDDYFKFVTTSDGKMVLTVTSDAALCVSMTVVSENGSVNLYSNGTCGGTHTNTITINNLAAGTYYIWADNTGYGNYTISNAFTAATLANDTEINDTRDLAINLALNSTVTGHLGYKNLLTDGIDFYKINTASDGKLTLTVSPDASLCVELTVISDNGSVNLYHNGLCGYTSHNNVLTVNNLAAGTYYISASAVGYGSYSLTSKFDLATLANDAEPNDSRDVAVTLAQNTSKTGHLGYKKLYADSDDYYKITTSADGKLTLTVTPEPTLCVDLTLISENGTINLYSNGLCGYTSHSDALVVNNLAAGTYYIRASGSGTGYGSYTLSSKLESPALVNDAEPNNSRETALNFVSNGSITGHLGYKNTITDDVDYFKIVTAGNINLTVTVTSDPTLCVNLSLINSTGSTTLKTNGSCGFTSHSETMTQNALAPGTYYILATPSGYGSYKISTSFNYITNTDDLLMNELAVFPNPADDKLCFYGKDMINSTLKISDLNGKTIFVKKFNNSDLQYYFDVSQLNSGLYFYEMKNKERIINGKFIIK